MHSEEIESDISRAHQMEISGGQAKFSEDSEGSGRKASQKIKMQDFPGGPGVKNLPANAGNTSSIPGPGGSHVPQSN